MSLLNTLGKAKRSSFYNNRKEFALFNVLRDKFRTQNVDNASVGLPDKNGEICSSWNLFDLPEETIDEAPELLENFSIKLKPDTIAQLRVIKQQLEKESKHPLTWEQAISAMIEKLQNPVSIRKTTKRNKKPVQTETTRYFPIEIKREALQKTKNLCAKCDKPAENLHHQIPFAVSKNHDSIIPLFKNHHIIEHHKEDSFINRKYQRCRS